MSSELFHTYYFHNAGTGGAGRVWALSSISLWWQRNKEFWGETPPQCDFAGRAALGKIWMCTRLLGHLQFCPPKDRKGREGYLEL